MRIVGEGRPSGDFFRASRREDEGSIVVGPSAPTSDAAAHELDRDAGGQQTRARPTLPGEPTFCPNAPARLPAMIAIALLTGGCAALQSFGDRAQSARREIEGTLAALDGLLDACEELQEPRPSVCEEAEQLEETLLAFPGLEVK